MHVVLLNPPRKRKRRAKMKVRRKRRARRNAGRRRGRGRRRRNYWPGERKRHGKAAYRGWHGRSKKTRKRFKKRPPSTAKKRKGRKKRRNTYIAPRYAMNPRRRRRRNAKYRYKSRGRRRNRVAATGRGITRTITAGLKPDLLKAVYPMAAGGIVNKALSTWTASLGFIPDMMKDGLGRRVLSLMTSGITGFLAGMVNRSWGGPVFLGGVIETLYAATEDILIPGLEKTFGLEGLMDYLTPQDVANRRALGGMTDYLTPQDVANRRALGDYQEFVSSGELHPGLGTMFPDYGPAVPDTLDPGLGQIATTPLDFPVRDKIDSVAGVELSS